MRPLTTFSRVNSFYVLGEFKQLEATSRTTTSRIKSIPGLSVHL